jgi:SAM-dependent methyltransferase
MRVLEGLPREETAGARTGEGPAYERVTACRCCGGAELLTYLKLGNQPLANAYHRGGAAEPRFPLELNLCLDCYHSQLSVAVSPDLMFENYLYVTGVSRTMRGHLRALAERALFGEAAPPQPGRRVRVLEIASNDGTLLECFRDFGCEVFGVDPARNLRAMTEAKGIDVLVDYWGPAAAAKLGARFDLIVACNVFAHVPDQAEFLAACDRALTPGGRVVIEFPYARHMLENCEFDTVYHEHNSVFLVNSFARLASRMRLVICDVLETPVHGGSVRFTLRRGAGGHCRRVYEMIRAERARGLFEAQTYFDFARRVHGRTLPALVTALDDLKRRGYKIIGYGASAKSTVVLNAAGVELPVEYIVDDTPLKIGHFTPGTGKPIRAASAVASEAEDQPLAFLILAWNFLDEILGRVAAVRRGQGRDVYITYVPEVGVHPLRGDAGEFNRQEDGGQCASCAERALLEVG